MLKLIKLFNIVKLKFCLYKLKFLNFVSNKPQTSGYNVILKWTI